VYLQVPPPPGGGGPIPGPIGPPGPPPLSYAYRSYLPYLIATTILPLAGLLYVALHTLVSARRGERLLRPENAFYQVFLIGGVADLAFGAVILYKLVNDSVYGTLPPWRWIDTFDDLLVYQEIASFLVKFYFIAGVACGLLLLLILLYRYYEYWYVDLIIYLGNIGLFLYLTPKPLKDFKFTGHYIATHNVTASTPYALVEPGFLHAFSAGVFVGGLIAGGIYVYYKVRAGEAARTRG